MRAKWWSLMMLMARSLAQIVGVWVVAKAIRRCAILGVQEGGTMFRYLWAMIAAAVVAMAAPSAMAQCMFNGSNTFQCSGNADGTIVVGSTVDDTFVFLNGTTGSIQVVSGSGHDVLDFSNFSSPISVDVTAAGPQVVAPGLTIWFQGFDGPLGVTIKGGAGSDTLIGGPGDDVLIGGPGADNLQGNGGTDRRGDTLVANCAGDTLSSIEIDSCAIPPAPVPTLSEWAMILLAAMLAGAAVLTIHRRQTA